MCGSPSRTDRKCKHKGKKILLTTIHGGEEFFVHIKTAASVLHRNDCFYTARAYFLIIPFLCIKLGMIIS